MMSEKQLQKFHTDEALTPRSQGSDINWLIRQVCHMAQLIRIYSKVEMTAITVITTYTHGLHT